MPCRLSYPIAIPRVHQSMAPPSFPPFTLLYAPPRAPFSSFVHTDTQNGGQRSHRRVYHIAEWKVVRAEWIRSHSLYSSPRSPPFLPFYSPVSSCRRRARARHPLKEDDRLEDTQAPANGFVLLASIGIKRIASSRYVSRNEDDNDVMEGGGRRSSYITRKEINIQWIFQIGILDEVMKLYFVTNVRKC